MKLDTYNLKYPQAVRHYAEGMAYTGKSDIANAKQALTKLQVLVKDKDLKEVTIWEINNVHDLVRIAEKVLEAEILMAEADESLGNLKKSTILLREAVAMEDALNYNEPPDWFFSIRHNLGKAYMLNSQPRMAIETYIEDLKRLPNNGWAHHGMLEGYNAIGNAEKVAETEELIKTSWATADVVLDGTKLK